MLGIYIYKYIYMMNDGDWDVDANFQIKHQSAIDDNKNDDFSKRKRE